MSDGDFYVRYYVGHKGKFGHEFLEFEIRPDGRLRYANNSNYKNDTMIRKEGKWRGLAQTPGSPRPLVRLSASRAHAVYVNQTVLSELQRIITESEIVRCNTTHRL